MRRSVSLVVSVLLVMGVFIGLVPSSAGAAGGRGTLGVVCVDRDGHAVRAPGSGSCRGGEERVRVRVGDRLRICAVSGSVRALGEAACLRKGGRSMVVPGNTPAWFCAARAGGQLRAVAGPGACRHGERALQSVNHRPGAITLAGGSIAEDAPAGSTVGTLAAADADRGDRLVLDLLEGAADNDLFALDGSSLVTAGPLDFESAPEYTVAVRVRDLLGKERTTEVTVAVADANDAPTAISLAPAAVAENAGATAVGTLGATDQDEGDTHAFTLVPGAGDEDNASFAIAGDRLSSLASFDFEKQSAYSVRVRVVDADGAAYEQALTVAVTDVDEPPAGGGGGGGTPPPPDPNHAPTGLTLSSSSVAENLPAGTPVGTLSASDVDLDLLTYALVAGAGSDDNASFAIVGDTLRTAASFDFETDSSYTVRVRVTDDGSPALSAEQAFTIDVTDVVEPNAAPIATDDSYTGIVGNTRATLGITPAPAGPNLALTGALPLVNDSDPDNDPLAVVAAVGVTTTGGGTVTIDADGSFTYLPKAGDRGTATTPLTDSFDYTVTDGEDTDTGTITLEFSTRRIWYVDDDAAAGGDGRSTAPLSSLDLIATDGNTDPDRQSDQIFVFAGSYPMTLPIDLMAGQSLIGAGTGLPDLGVPAGTAPLITRDDTGSGAVVVLANNSLVDGVAIEAGGALNAVLASGGTGGTVGPAATLRGTGTAPVVVVSGAGVNDVTIEAPVTAAGTGRPVNVNGRTGGTITFSGLVQTAGSTANGVSLAANTGATVRFEGGLAVSTTGSNRKALTATGGGTLTVTGSANTLTTGSSTALEVQDVTIGADGLTFRSISTAGAPSGIVLERTGSVAGLTVTGSSAGTCGGAGGDNADCTGGTIAGSTAEGIRLVDTNSPSFTRVRVTASLGDGILASGVTGLLTVQNSAVQSSGASAIAIGSLSGTSTFSVTGNRITQSTLSAVVVTGTGGTGTPSGWVSNNAIGSGTALACSALGNGVDVANLTGTAVLTVGIANNSIRSCANRGIRVVAAGGAQINATLTGNDVSQVGAEAVYAEFGIPTQPPADSCLAASGNSLSGAALSLFDLFVVTAYTLRMPSGVPDATAALVTANPLAARISAIAEGGGSFTAGACPTPA